MMKKRWICALLTILFFLPLGAWTEGGETPADPAQQQAMEAPRATEQPATEQPAEEKPAEKQPVEEKKDQTVVVTFLGDCTLGGEERVRNKTYSFDGVLKAQGYDYFFKNLTPILGADDLTVANLEGVFYNEESGKTKGKTFNFRGGTDYVKVLTSSSVECVTLANNHIMDYGKKGIQSTVKTLDKAKVHWFVTNEAYDRTYIYTKGEIKIGFVGTEISFYSKNQEKVEQKIRELKKAGCQVIVGVMHGGGEYMSLRNKSQERTAKRMVDLGCGLVIGHHPHVLQGMDVYKNATICYSIGNCVFGGNKEFKRVRAKYSALFQVTFSFDGRGNYKGHQVNIIPIVVTSDATERENNYQPILATGKKAQGILKHVQADTKEMKLKPYQNNVGAVQNFVPAPKTKK